MSDADSLPLDRWASRRAEYVETTTMLSRREAEAVAYSERGFSDAGVAKRVDATAGTVTNYLDRAVARFGPEVRLPCLDEDPPLEADLSPVAYEDIAEMGSAAREAWYAAVERHPEYEPPAITEVEQRARATATDAPGVADG
jgi:hypothetical protein